MACVCFRLHSGTANGSWKREVRRPPNFSFKVERPIKRSASATTCENHIARSRPLHFANVVDHSPHPRLLSAYIPSRLFSPISQMHSQIAQRLRKSSISAVPPPQTSAEYSPTLATLAARILYRTPLPSKNGLPIFILNAGDFPHAKEVNYDTLLPYVLARLPGEDELIGGKGYEVIFFAGGGSDGPGSGKDERPKWLWFVQAYHVVRFSTQADFRLRLRSNPYTVDESNAKAITKALHRT